MTNEEAKFLMMQVEMLDHRNAAIRLSDALMDIYNLCGEDKHIQNTIKSVDDVISLYYGLEQE